MTREILYVLIPAVILVALWEGGLTLRNIKRDGFGVTVMLSIFGALFLAAMRYVYHLIFS